MAPVKTYLINLYALKQSPYECDYELDSAFFSALDQQEILGGNVHAKVALEPVSGNFMLKMHVSGKVQVVCDRCLDPMSQPVDGEEELLVKLTAGAVDDDIVAVDPETGDLDLAWLLYELIELSLPVVHSHQQGECNPLMEELLRSHLCTAAEDPEE